MRYTNRWARSASDLVFSLEKRFLRNLVPMEVNVCSDGYSNYFHPLVLTCLTDKLQERRAMRHSFGVRETMPRPLSPGRVKEWRLGPGSWFPPPATSNRT
jgi:hypothetical protein